MVHCLGITTFTHALMRLAQLWKMEEVGWCGHAHSGSCMWQVNSLFSGLDCRTATSRYLEICRCSELEKNSPLIHNGGTYACHKHSTYDVGHATHLVIDLNKKLYSCNNTTNNMFTLFLCHTRQAVARTVCSTRICGEEACMMALLHDDECDGWPVVLVCRLTQLFACCSYLLMQQTPSVQSTPHCHITLDMQIAWCNNGPPQ